MFKKNFDLAGARRRSGDNNSKCDKCPGKDEEDVNRKK